MVCEKMEKGIDRAPCPKTEQFTWEEVTMGIMLSEVYEALIAAGAPEDKAKAAAEAIPVSDVLATKEDIAGIKQDIAALRAEFQQDIAGLRAETKQDIARLENRLTRLELAVFGGGATGLALLIKLAFFS